MAYFTKRLAQVQYAVFRAALYPIGSGSTESANKIVVEVRLKGSGMHWARAHVDPLVALRTVACANRWPEAWRRISAHLRTEAEQRRRARRRARQPTSTPGLVECAPTGPVAQPAVALATPPRRAKSVVNGQPTALHPWKRFGYDPRLTTQRALRFPR